jgi:hypothetical protein
VSFGWNDPAGAMDQADSDFAGSETFKALNPTWIGLRRVLLRYQAYLVAMQFGAPPPPSSPASSNRPRIDRSA